MNQKKLISKLKKATSASQKKDHITTIKLCRDILYKSPVNIPAHQLLITNLIALKRHDEVEAIIKKVILLMTEPKVYAFEHLLGCNYISQENYTAALLVLEPLFNKSGDSKFLLDIALAYFRLGDYESARIIYLKLIELEPNNHQAKFNLYPILLHFKDYKNAWGCFHSRLGLDIIKDKVHWFAPPWSGETLRGKNIVIHPEQGMGDNLAYSGCFAEAIADAKSTHIICDKRLKGLYQANFPTAFIYSSEDVNQTKHIYAELDVQVLGGSLAALYRLNDESFINEPSLNVPQFLQQEKNCRLSDKKLKVGISWFHGRINDGNKHSMHLEELLPLLQIENIEWVNLQFGDWQSEVKKVESKYGIKITHFDDCCASGDFEHYGALIASLDLVIAASNAALMFATRLGIKAWMFLPAPNTILQQENFEDFNKRHKERRFYRSNDEGWEGVVQQMCNEIKLL